MTAEDLAREVEEQQAKYIVDVLREALREAREDTAQRCADIAESKHPAVSGCFVAEEIRREFGIDPAPRKAYPGFRSSDPTDLSDYAGDAQIVDIPNA